ncbi:RING-H2 finger protein ATL3-like [Diospyros lotus]|uniref:RING-H2 finger protein ATL3-like n=1 Tax=Diospyros lotus TaxID=55363 RepID=UPI0022582716|nr:RING-H2 finger protein ATL3-like [Diospyros lotus]
MGDSSEWSRALSDSRGKIMAAGLVVLFVVMVFVLFLHLYAKWFWYRREEEEESSSSAGTRRRRRLDFTPGYQDPAVAGGTRRGLDPSVLKTLPVLIFNPKDFSDGLECAVCLTELAGGDKARLLPKCNHGFHVDCIDMWFQSHATCPICRNPVSAQSPSEFPRSETHQTESPSFPTNVLFWGNQTQVSTLGSALEEDRQASSSSSSSSSSSPPPSQADGILVIDISRQIQIADEEEPKSPVTTRLRSLKRLLSRDRRVNPCGPSVDAEPASRA